MKSLLLSGLIFFSANLLGRELQTVQEYVPVVEEPHSRAPQMLTVSKGHTFRCRNRVGMYWEVLLENGAWAYIDSRKVVLKQSVDGPVQDLIKRVQLRKGGQVPAINRTPAIAPSSRYASTKSMDVVQNNPPNFRLVYLIESLEWDKESRDAFAEALLDEIAGKTNGPNL